MKKLKVHYKHYKALCGATGSDMVQETTEISKVTCRHCLKWATGLKHSKYGVAPSKLHVLARGYWILQLTKTQI